MASLDTVVVSSYVDGLNHQMQGQMDRLHTMNKAQEREEDTMQQRLTSLLATRRPFLFRTTQEFRQAENVKLKADLSEI